MSVSEPGTATIFTHVVVLCLLNASTMFFSLSVSGGVCDVQKRACLVPELHPGSGAPEVCPPGAHATPTTRKRSEEHTSELQSRVDLVCRLLLEKKKNTRK